MSKVAPMEPGYSLFVQRIPLVNEGETRDDYIKTIVQSLGEGGVVKMLVQKDQPVYVERLVEGDFELPEDPSVVLDPQEEIRNAELEAPQRSEYKGVASWGVSLAFKMIVARGFVPRFFLAHNVKMFVKSLQMPFVSHHAGAPLLYGHMAVLGSKDLPEGVVVVAATETFVSPLFEVVFGVKIIYE